MQHREAAAGLLVWWVLRLRRLWGDDYHRRLDGNTHRNGLLHGGHHRREQERVKSFLVPERRAASKARVCA